MNTQSKVLLIAGTAIAGTCYTPAQKPQPSQEVVNKYITTHTSKWKYSPQRNGADWSRSEARKQELLGDIKSIRAQIYAKAVRIRQSIEADQGRCHTLITTICARTMNAARYRENEVLSKRAKEINVPKQLLDRNKILARNGIVSIDIV